MSLQEVIEILSAEDPAKVVPIGFAHPHSWRGDYSELAFEVRADVTVGSMLEVAQSAVGSTFEGWKGGDYKMSEYTSCWLVAEEGTSDGELIEPLFLKLLLGNTTLTVADRFEIREPWHA